MAIKTERAATDRGTGGDGGRERIGVLAQSCSVLVTVVTFWMTRLVVDTATTPGWLISLTLHAQHATPNRHWLLTIRIKII